MSSNMFTTLKSKVKKILVKIDKKLPLSIFYVFIMSTEEKKLFDKEIKNSKVYVEFGMGGSTFRALQKSKAIIYSIDSSTEWISLMREYRQIRNAEKKKRLELFHVDIGPTEGWGRPIGNSDKEKFPEYSSNIFNLIDVNTIDTVLIDGRFRVACALKTIIECNNINVKIIIHDFTVREEYQILLNYLEIVSQANSLIVCKVKDDIDLNSVIKEYEIYKYIFA